MKTRVSCLVLLAVAPLLAEEAALPPQKVCRWRVCYEDAALGWVKGEAFVDWKKGSAQVRFDDPLGGAPCFLNGAISPPEGGANDYAVRLSGASPAVPATPRQDPRLLPGLDASADAKVGVRLGEATASGETDVPQTPDGNEVRLSLEATSDGNLYGVWSYESDPVTERNKDGGGRMGKFRMQPREDAEGTHRFIGVTSGGEYWTQEPAEIYGVIVLEDQFAVDGKGKARMPYGGSLWRHVLVIGKDLPYLGTRALAEVEPAQSWISYKLVATRESKDLDEKLAKLLEDGWNRMLARADEETAARVKGSEWALFETAASGEVTSCVASFAWGGGRGTWLLQWGDNGARADFVRRLPDGTWERTPWLFLPERVAIEVETDVAMPLKELTIRLSRRTAADETEELKAACVDGRVYRTPEIDVLTQEGTAEDAGHAHLDDGEVLAAAVVQGDRPFVGEVVASSKAIVTPEESLGPWYDALATAARIAGAEPKDWKTLPFKTVQEIGSQYGIPLGRRKVSITLGEHAALLLLRQAFVEMLAAQAEQLAAVTETRAGRVGFARLMEQQLRFDRESPVYQIEVNVGGEKVAFGEAVRAQPGYLSLRQSAMLLAARGQTTMDQVLRATFGLED